ncbi:MAG: GMC family oxidoreductase N-terminal domain-containing protein [Myxococcota bacterium]
MSTQIHDFIIVGAGSAGCALAHRLSSDRQTSVLVLEAGGSERTPDVIIPAAFSKLFRSERDWNYSSDPEPHLDRRSLYIPRGKMLGGCSSMNAMIYIRGRRHDYDHWKEQGCDGWGYDQVLPLFKRSEDNERGADAFHGVGGPLRVSNARDPRPLSAVFIEGAAAAGIARNQDFNGPSQDGAGYYQVTQHRGRRWSTASAFLRPAMRRRNLTVLTRAMAARVVLDSGRAVGVQYVKGNQVHIARARREVILASGAIGSPQLLMLSGIGPADHLRAVGVPVAVDLPAVGDNLQDHPYVSQVWESKRGDTLADAESPRNVLAFLTARRGPLTSNVAESGAFVHSKPGLPAADIQYHFVPGYFVDHGFDQHPGHTFTMGTTLIAPESRGRLRLRSADPWARPSIVGNHLSTQSDMDAMIRGIEIGRSIAATRPFEPFRGAELFPGPGVKSRSELEAFVRRATELLYHPSGTCRMGADEGSVVDPQLRVRGVDNLRVADASIMPVVIGGNTNAPSIMIGERAGDLLA